MIGAESRIAMRLKGNRLSEADFVRHDEAGPVVRSHEF